VPVNLAQLVDKEAATFRDPREIRIQSKLAIDLRVMADDVELGRVFANLFENARRYGRSTDTGIAMVQVTCRRVPAIVSVGTMARRNEDGPADHTVFRGAARTAAPAILAWPSSKRHWRGWVARSNSATPVTAGWSPISA
jgi:hypothetical protein